MSTNNNDAENHLHQTEKKWFAVYTRYKREKLVAKALAQKDIECYLPINHVTRQWGRKRRDVELPLIYCYAFVRIVKNEYVRVLETEDVLNFVRFAKNLISIPDAEIDLLKRVTGEYRELEVVKAGEGIEAGDWVEIIGGSLTGTKGKLVEKENGKKFVVELESMGYSLLLEVNPQMLRKV